MTRITVNVAALPEVGLLRPAIEAALAGRAWPGGPEATVAAAVAAHVAQSQPAQEPGSGPTTSGGGTPS